MSSKKKDTTARDAKRVFNGAIRKLRAAKEEGKLTPLEAKAMRDSWYPSVDKEAKPIPAEYLP